MPRPLFGPGLRQLGKRPVPEGVLPYQTPRAEHYTSQKKNNICIQEKKEKTTSAAAPYPKKKNMAANSAAEPAPAEEPAKMTFEKASKFVVEFFNTKSDEIKTATEKVNGIASTTKKKWNRAVKQSMRYKFKDINKNVEQTLQNFGKHLPKLLDAAEIQSMIKNKKERKWLMRFFKVIYVLIQYHTAHFSSGDGGVVVAENEQTEGDKPNLGSVLTFMLDDYLKTWLHEPIFEKFRIPELVGLVNPKNEPEKKELSTELVLNHQKIVETLSWYNVNQKNIVGEIYGTRELQKAALNEWISNDDLVKFDWDFVRANRAKTNFKEIKTNAPHLSYREICQKMYIQAKIEFSQENLDFLFDVHVAKQAWEEATDPDEKEAERIKLLNIIKNDEGLNCQTNTSHINVESVNRNLFCNDSEAKNDSKTEQNLKKIISNVKESLKDTANRINI